MLSLGRMAGRTKLDLTICKQCSSSITGTTGDMACEGFCGGAFHTKCAFLTVDELKAHRKNRNLWWICDECIILMRKMRDGVCTQRMEKTSTESKVDCNVNNTSVSTDCSPVDNCKLEVVAKELSEVKTQIAALYDDIAGLKSAKETVLDSSLNVSFSPLSSTKLMHGSKRVENTSLRSRLDESDRFWLFFTRIKNTVTEDQMLEMVRESLKECKDDVVIQKLVPYWKDVSMMQFISFKVGVHPSLRHAALSPSTWPVGVCFREFHSNLHTWNPHC